MKREREGVTKGGIRDDQEVFISPNQQERRGYRGHKVIVSLTKSSIRTSSCSSPSTSHSTFPPCFILFSARHLPSSSYASLSAIFSFFLSFRHLRSLTLPFLLSLFLFHFSSLSSYLSYSSATLLLFT